MEMETRVKVWNPNKFNVGVTLFDGRTLNIVAGSFNMLTRNDILYVSTTSTLFKRGLLRVEEEAKPVLDELGIVEENNAGFMSEEEMKKKLNMSAAKLASWMEEITDEVVLDRIAQLAKSIDLPTSKMRVVEEKVPKAFMVD